MRNTNNYRTCNACLEQKGQDGLFDCHLTADNRCVHASAPASLDTLAALIPMAVTPSGLNKSSTSTLGHSGHEGNAVAWH